MQSQRHRIEVRPLQIDEWGEEVVPGGLKGKNGNGCQRRRGKGQDDAPEDLQKVGPIYGGGVFKVCRNGEEKLAQQKDVEGAAEEGGRGERQKGVDPAKPVEQDIERRHGDRIGQHHRRQHHDKEGVAPRRTQAGKGIGDQRARKQVAEDGQQADDGGVEYIAVKGQDGQRLAVVSPRRRVGNPARRRLKDLVVGLER